MNTDIVLESWGIHVIQDRHVSQRFNDDMDKVARALIHRGMKKQLRKVSSWGQALNVQPERS